MRYEIIETNTPPRQAYCPGCQWKGNLGECVTENEQESYEGPFYTIAFCPVCNCDEVQGI